MAAICEKDFALHVASGAPPPPDFYWTMDDTLVDSIESLAFNPPLISNFGTGIIANGFNYVPTLNAQNNLETGEISDIQYTTGSPISLTFWIKWTIGFDANDQIAHSIDNANGPDDLNLGVRWGHVFGVLHITLDINNGVDFDSDTTPFPISFGQWYFFVLIYDPATQLCTLYRNNVPILDTTIPVLLPTSLANNIRYRDIGSAGGPAMDYILDECGWWLNYKLTDEDMTFLFNSGSAQRPPFS